MIVLKRIDATLVEKIVQPGQTEEFFDLDLYRYDSFDWEVKILSGGLKGTTKIASLYNDNTIESTRYAFLGERFNTDTNIYVSGGTRCKLEVTNNEASVIRCKIRLKTF
jgi:hypothetical protein